MEPTTHTGVYFSWLCPEYGKPQFKWFLSIGHGVNNWKTSASKFIHADNYAPTLQSSSKVYQSKPSYILVGNIQAERHIVTYK